LSPSLRLEKLVEKFVTVTTLDTAAFGSAVVKGFLAAIYSLPAEPRCSCSLQKGARHADVTGVGLVRADMEYSMLHAIRPRLVGSPLDCQWTLAARAIRRLECALQRQGTQSPSSSNLMGLMTGIRKARQ
jgi:hypothetical protein